MTKRGRIEVAEFIDGEYVFPTGKRSYVPAVSTSVVLSPMIMPVVGYAETVDTFKRIYEASMTAIDAGVVFVIIFAGVSWMLGNRGKSMELLLGAAAGYLIIRNAVHIRDALKSLVPELGGI